MMPGTIVAEKVKTKKADGTEGHRWKTYVVKSVTQTGIVTMLRADEHSSMEAKTNKGFAEMVASGKFEDWKALATAGIDRVLGEEIDRRIAEEEAK